MLTIVKEDTKNSMNFIFKEKPVLRKLVFIICIINALISALIMISLPVLISQRLALSEEMYGIAQAILALGGLIGGVMTGILGEKICMKNLYQCIGFVAFSLLPMAFIMTVSIFASPLGQAFYGIVFEYLIGYECFIVLCSIVMALLVSLYTKKIKFD